jgi:adenosylhomocysteine nucleosidase
MQLLIAALSDEVSGILRTGSYETVPCPNGFVAYRSRAEDKSNPVDTAIILTGTGRLRASDGAKWAVDHFHPDSIVSIGYGGGTLSTLQPGDLVLGTQLYRLDGSPFYWDTSQLGDPLLPDRNLLAGARNAVEVAGIDFEMGPIINVPTIARTAGMKQWIGEELGGVCVEMESFMVAEVAVDAGLPFVVIRAIVDTVEMDLPELVGNIGQAPNSRRVLPAIKHLSRHPADISDLARLGRSAARARRALTGFFNEFSSELAAAEESAVSEAVGQAL